MLEGVSFQSTRFMYLADWKVSLQGTHTSPAGRETFQLERYMPR
jgi:hypothetical protein